MGQQPIPQGIIHQAVPIVDSKEICIPEEAPVPAAAIQHAQPPAKHIFTVVEQHIAKGQNRHYNHQIPINLRRLKFQRAHHRGKQADKQETGQKPQVLNITDAQLPGDGEELAPTNPFPTNQQYACQRQEHPNHRNHQQMQAAPGIPLQIHRLFQCQRAAHHKKQGHTAAQKRFKEIPEVSHHRGRMDHVRHIRIQHMVQDHQVHTQHFDSVQPVLALGHFHGNPSFLLILPWLSRKINHRLTNSVPFFRS